MIESGRRLHPGNGARSGFAAIRDGFAVEAVLDPLHIHRLRGRRRGEVALAGQMDAFNIRTIGALLLLIDRALQKRMKA